MVKIITAENFKEYFVLVLNHGLSIFLVMYYIIFVLPKQRKSYELMQKINSENINSMRENYQEKADELREAINETSFVLEKLTDKMTENHNELIEVLKNTKQFTREEMYNYISLRFQLSIKKIISHFITTVLENNLHQNKELILYEIKDIITNNVKEGREYIYSLNFDERLLDTIFSETDEKIKEANIIITRLFEEFFEVQMPQAHDYTTLRRKLKNLGDKFTNNCDDMLKKRLLRQ